MRVRLTHVVGGDEVVEGWADRPPVVGKAFVVDVPAESEDYDGRLFQTPAIVEMHLGAFTDAEGGRWSIELLDGPFLSYTRIMA